jgi:hypothetical protein
MAWTATRAWLFGDVLTEDFANDYFSGNLDELRGGGLAIASQAANDIIIGASATQLGRIPTANNAVLVTNGSGVPSLASALPSAVSVVESQITDGSILARVADNEAIAGSWTFNARPTFNKSDTGVGTVTDVMLLRRSGASPSTTARGVGMAFMDGDNNTWVGGLVGWRENSSLHYGGGLRFYTTASSTGSPSTSWSNLVHRGSITSDGVFDWLGTVSAIAPEANAAGFNLRARPTDDQGRMQWLNNAGSTVWGLINGLSTGGGSLSISAGGSTGYLAFNTNGVERARIDATGLGIGVTPSVALHVLKAANSDYIGILRNSGGSNPWGLLINYSTTDPNNTSSPFLQCYGTTTLRMSVSANGGINNFSANNVNLSDEGSKRIKGPAQAQRAKFRQLQLVEGRYLDTTRENDDVMVTAQDVETIYPELVEEFGTTGMKGVREHGLMMRAFKVIQELSDENESLAVRVAALEAARGPR